MKKTYSKSSKIKNACHLMAEHVRRVTIDEDLYKEMKFIRSDVIKYLLREVNQEDFYVGFNRNNQGF